MADDSMITFRVQIADQSFHVRIPPEEKPNYERIARFLQNVYNDIRDQGFAAGGAQVWAMTAFQLATELFEAHEDLGRPEEDDERIARMIQRIEAGMRQR